MLDLNSENINLKEIAAADDLDQASRLPARKRRSFSLNVSIINFFIFFAIISMSVGYFLISNNLIYQGFYINEVKDEMEEKQKTNKDLELAVMNMESYEEVEKRIKELGMVAVGEIEYLEVKSGEVAMK
ncbi:MAG: hypothetical protein Q8Q23_03840 [bacterium]|nr:hypothetical protein [bacterium]